MAHGPGCSSTRRSAITRWAASSGPCRWTPPSIVPTSTPLAPAKRGALRVQIGGFATLGGAAGSRPIPRGRLTTKVHLAVDGRGLPLSIVLTPGNVNDSTMFDAVLNAIYVPRSGIGQAPTPT